MLSFLSLGRRIPKTFRHMNPVPSVLALRKPADCNTLFDFEIRMNVVSQYKPSEICGATLKHTDSMTTGSF